MTHYFPEQLWNLAVRLLLQTTKKFRMCDVYSTGQFISQRVKAWANRRMKCKPLWSSDCLSSLLIPVEWRVEGREVVMLPSVGMGRDWDVLHPFPIHSIPSQLFRKRSEEPLHLQTPPHHHQMQLFNKWRLISEEAWIREDDAGGTWVLLALAAFPCVRTQFVLLCESDVNPEHGKYLTFPLVWTAEPPFFLV